MATLDSLHSHLSNINELVYRKCGFELTNLLLNTEGIEYGACSFELNGKKIQHRISKITPTKAGQFVTIWKRNQDGITEPFNSTDDLDFVIITSLSEGHFGQFVFPKTVLADKGIISRNGKGGKRGIRVYPPWDIAPNRQASETQRWQVPYFLLIPAVEATDFNVLRKLLLQK